MGLAVELPGCANLAPDREPGSAVDTSVLHGGPSKTVISHQRSPSTRRCLQPEVVVHRRLSSSEACLPPKVVFRRRLSSTKGRLPPKVVFQRRLSSTEGCLPPKVVFHRRLSTTYHNTLVDLIFVRVVNIPNLKFFFDETHTNGQSHMLRQHAP